MRLKSIDFLRGIAVMLVLFRHKALFEITRQVGWAGVDLFFVLSGFLVSGLLFNEFAKTGKINTGRFLIRRGFKIYPAFYIMIGATLLAEYIAKTLRPDWYNIAKTDSLIAEVLFIQNYKLGIWNHTWSLAIEEHFYLLLALAFWLIFRFTKNTGRSVLVFCFAIIAFCNFMKIRLWFSGAEYNWFTQLYPTHLRADSLVFGVLLSYFYHNKKEQFTAFFKNNKWLLTVLCIACLSFPFIFSLDKPEQAMAVISFGFTVLYLGFGTLLGLVISHPGTESTLRKIISNWLFSGICYVGFYSYSIYLWHMFFVRYLPNVLKWIFGYDFNIYLAFAVYFACSIAFGILLGKAIEIPFLRLREKWFGKNRVLAN